MKNINLVGEDEYLTILQTAYILGVQRRFIEYLLSNKRIKADKAGNKRLIKRSYLYEYVCNKLSKYSKVYEYIECENKIEYWKKYPDVCKNLNEDISMLTQNQVAHLLNITIKGVCKQINELGLEVVKVQRRSYIPIQYLLNYVEKNISKYDLACEYFMQEPEEFWNHHYERMLATTVKEERIRKKAEHERKVQKKAGRTDNSRTEGAAGAEGTKEEI